MEDGAIIVVLSDGRVQFWQQDSPEVRELLEAIEELSTCECSEDVCPAGEMLDWREQLMMGQPRVHGRE